MAGMVMPRDRSTHKLLHFPVQLILSLVWSGLVPSLWKSLWFPRGEAGNFSSSGASSSPLPCELLCVRLSLTSMALGSQSVLLPPVSPKGIPGSPWRSPGAVFNPSQLRQALWSFGGTAG